MLRRYFVEAKPDMPRHLNEGVTIDVFKGYGHTIAIVEIDDAFTTEQKMAILEQLGNPEPLQRIFEMNQQHEYTLHEGQLKKELGAKKRFLSHLTLQPNPILLKDYIAVHAMGKVWPEIIQNMITVGVLDMELYIKGYDAFLMMDTISDFDIEEKGKLWATLPREMEWQAYVSRFQQSAENAAPTEKWKPMTLILEKF